MKALQAMKMLQLFHLKIFDQKFEYFREKKNLPPFNHFSLKIFILQKFLFFIQLKLFFFLLLILTTSDFYLFRTFFVQKEIFFLAVKCSI